jgi:hypothetical protein
VNAIDIGEEQETLVVEPASDPFERPAESPTEPEPAPDRVVQPA